MSRIARNDKKANTGVYHIILRSVNQQEIFYDDNDKRKFLQYLQEVKEKYNCALYAYVLMNNHIHLLLKDKEEKLSKIIQSLATSYAMYFNKKYERIGHVFYNRFNSKSIEELPYLLNTLRYIHYNPEKGGICSFEKYQWSSYHLYYSNSNFISKKAVLIFFDSNITNFRTFHEEYKNSKNDEDEVEFELYNIKKLNDEKAIEKIKEKLEIDNIMIIQSVSNNVRDEMIRKISTINGITREQLARITGINKRMIYRIIKKKKVS